MTAPTRRVALFLGAGASAKAGVPTTFKFVEAFRTSLVARTTTKNVTRRVDPHLLLVLDQLLRVLRRWKGRVTPNDDRVDVELLLEALTLAGSLKDQVASALHYGNPVAVVGKKKELDTLLSLLQRFIREECYVGPYAAEYLAPLRRFIRENNPVHVFTVNYDLVVEQFLERNGRQFTDGFDLYWNPGNLLDDRFEVYLYKLHGSVTWYRTPDGRSLKLPLRLIQPRFPLATGGVAQPLMLYPAQKWVNSGVYLRLLSLLHETLGVAEYAFVVGYSFRDDHFVRAFQEAASANPKLWVILVGPRAEAVYQEKLRYVLDPDIPGAKSESNLSGRVLRLPFLYENVIPSLYSVIWANISDAVSSDVSATSQAEAGAEVKWHEIAIKYLEAGQLERPIELEESGIDWTKVGDAYAIDFYGRKAVLLSFAGKDDDAKVAWERVRELLERWLLWQLSFELLGDYGIRLKLATQPTGAKSADQVRSELGGLTRFCRRYSAYFSDGFPKTREYLGRVLSVDEYLEEIPEIGLAFESYANSRSSLAPQPTAALVKRLTEARSKGTSAAVATEEVMADFLTTERSYILTRMGFLAEIPISDRPES